MVIATVQVHPMIYQPKSPLFWMKGPPFWGFNHQNRGWTGSRYIYPKVAGKSFKIFRKAQLSVAKEKLPAITKEGIREGSIDRGKWGTLLKTNGCNPKIGSSGRCFSSSNRAVHQNPGTLCCIQGMEGNPVIWGLVHMPLWESNEPIRIQWDDNTVLFTLLKCGYFQVCGGVKNGSSRGPKIYLLVKSTLFQREFESDETHVSKSSGWFSTFFLKWNRSGSLILIWTSKDIMIPPKFHRGFFIGYKKNHPPRGL